MGNVFVNVGMSLDGFLAGPNGGPKNPLGDGGVAIHQWAFQTRAFMEHLGMEGEIPSVVTTKSLNTHLKGPAPISWEEGCLMRGNTTGPKTHLSMRP
jgi:hypothetical protein